jgi:hypothetical protein
VDSSFRAGAPQSSAGEGWYHVGKVFVVATVLDGIYQFIVFHRVYITGAVTIALIPYFLLRGLVNRIASQRFRSPGPGRGES